MERHVKILVILLAASLILNFSAITQISMLRQRIENQNHSLNNNQTRLNNIEGSISTLAGRVDKWAKEARLISSEKFKANKEKSTKDAIYLDVEWSFNEIEKGARVILLYSISGSEDWMSEEARRLGEGIYKASMLLSPEKEYLYKVAVEGSVVRTSEISPVPAEHYIITPVRISSISMSGSSKTALSNMDVEVHQRGPVNLGFFKPARVQIKVYQGSVVERVLDLTEVQGLGDSMRVWNARGMNFFKPPTSIILEVEYDDGTIQRGEIWPQDKYNTNIKP